MPWLAVWTRATIMPAARRAAAVWAGALIVGAIVFGGNGMQPRDLTGLAMRVPAVGVVLAATWILLFVPAARLLVRWDAASYLRALPGPRIAPIVVAAAALVVLQLPWLVLWLAGAGVRGAIVVVGVSVPVAALARWQPRPPRSRSPRWRSATTALVGVYARALTRRAGYALVRGAGLAVLAGITGGLLARNNDLAGARAATPACVAIAIVLVPGWAGLLAPLLDAQRASAWLAASLGVADRMRVAVLAAAVTAVYVAGGLFAATAASIVIGDGGSIAPVVGAVVAMAAGTSLIATRALVWADRSDAARWIRVVLAAVIASATAVIALGVLGLPGLAALAATGVFSLATVQP